MPVIVAIMRNRHPVLSMLMLNWSQIDTVLLDMDGTLLDLQFDNYFWLQLVPQKYAQARGLSLAAAQAELTPRFAAFHGRLEWYCTDHWSRELQLDIAGLKHEAREHIRWLPGVPSFLKTLRKRGKRLVLVTNAHPDSLAIKDAKTGLGAHVDAMVSSHQLGLPKEEARFWPALANVQPFDCTRTLFVDDSLPVLRAARAHGVAHLIRVTHPDTTQAPGSCDEFQAVNSIAHLIAD